MVMLLQIGAHTGIASWLFAPLAPRLKRAFVVHGEETQPPAMRELLNRLGCRDVVIPSPGETFKI